MGPTPDTRAEYLVVDDQSFVRDIVKDYLTHMGITGIYEAGDGNEAIDVVRVLRGNVGCIISDFRMPNMSGLALLQAVRAGQTEAARDTPFVMLTMYADKFVLGLAMALEVDHFIAKPVSKNQLETRLAAIGQRPRPTLLPASEYARISVENALGPGWNDSSDTAETARAVSDIDKVVRSLAERDAAGVGDGGGSPDTAVELDVASLPTTGVLTRDVRTASGALLLAAGSRLNERIVDRLMDIEDLGEDLGLIQVRT